MNTIRQYIFCFLLILITVPVMAHADNDSLFYQVRFSIPFSQSAGPSSVIVPFDIEGGLIVIKAKVNDIEGSFIVDTGANGLVLNKHYFTPSQLLADRGVGVSGATSEVGTLQVDSLFFDEIVFSRMEAQTIDLRQLENRKNMRILGLIGYKVIRNFEIMFDYRQRFLTFSKLDKAGNILLSLPHTEQKVDSFDFYLGNFIPVIEVKVDKKKKKMGIDTGAEVNLLNVKRSRNIMSNLKIQKTIEMAGANKKTVDALAGKLYRLSLKDRYKCAGMSTVVVNFKHLESIYQTKLDGILGYEFLAPWLFSINYKKQRLFLHKLEYIKP